MRPICCLLLGACLLGMSCPSEAQHLYWTNHTTGKIQRANLDGSQIQDVLTGLNSPSALAIDFPNQMIYWSELAPTPILRRAHLDGSNPQTLLSTPGEPLDIALDPADGRLYWSEYYGKIRRANLDGSNPQDIIFIDPLDDAGLTGTNGGALELINDKLYYPSPNGGRISRSDLDGSNAAVFLQSGSGGPWGFAADVSTGSLYFIDEDDNRISRIPLDSDVPLEFFSPGVHLDLFNIYNYLGTDSFPNGLAIDTAAGHFYWSEGATNSIYRVNLDGSNPQLILALDGTPRRLVLIPEPASILTLLLCLLAQILARRRERLPSPAV